MADIIKEFTNVTRRGLLRGAATTVSGAALAVALSSDPAAAAMTQKAAGYQGTPKDGKSCATCSFFKAGGTCIIVAGTISPQGYCRFYSKKA